MNITNLAAVTHAPQTNIPLSTSQCAQDFAALQNALQSGDLSAARGAFTDFWQAVAPASGPNRMFLPDAQTSHDLQAVGNSLTSANLTGARWAFALFQKDLMGTSSSVAGPVFHNYRPHNLLMSKP